MGTEDKRRSTKSAHFIVYKTRHHRRALRSFYFLLLKAFYNSRLFSSHSTVIDQSLMAIIIYDYVYAIVESAL